MRPSSQEKSQSVPFTTSKRAGKPNTRRSSLSSPSGHQVTKRWFSEDWPSGTWKPQLGLGSLPEGSRGLSFPGTRLPYDSKTAEETHTDGHHLSNNSGYVHTQTCPYISPHLTLHESLRTFDGCLANDLTCRRSQTRSRPTLLHLNPSAGPSALPEGAGVWGTLDASRPRPVLRLLLWTRVLGVNYVGFVVQLCYIFFLIIHYSFNK